MLIFSVGQGNDRNGCFMRQLLYKTLEKANKSADTKHLSLSNPYPDKSDFNNQYDFTSATTNDQRKYSGISSHNLLICRISPKFLSLLEDQKYLLSKYKQISREAKIHTSGMFQKGYIF